MKFKIKNKDVYLTAYRIHLSPIAFNKVIGEHEKNFYLDFLFWEFRIESINQV